MTSMGPTELERAMKTLVTTFHKYSVKSGDRQIVSKEKFKRLMETEMPSVTKKDPAGIDRVMKNLGMEDRVQLDFFEFVELVSRVIMSVFD